MTEGVTERRLEIARHYNAPRASVFAAWTEPGRMKHWWGPAGWTITFSEADLRPGGAFRYAMRSPEGDEHIVEGVIGEIDPPRLYATASELGGDGQHPPVRMVTTVTLEEQDGGTLVTLVTVATAAADIIDAATEGMDQHTSEHLDRLGEHLFEGEGSMTERSVTHSTFVIERNYDAPMSLVWEAWSTEEAKSRWFGGPEDAWASLERAMDFRVGGREKAVGRFRSGTVSAFDALYWDIIPGERIVYTYEMHIDGTKISVSLATVEFRPAGEGTRLTVTEAGAFLDGYDNSGSREHGTRALLDQLGASLKEKADG